MISLVHFCPKEAAVWKGKGTKYERGVKTIEGTRETRISQELRGEDRNVNPMLTYKPLRDSIIWSPSCTKGEKKEEIQENCHFDFLTEDLMSLLYSDEVLTLPEFPMKKQLLEHERNSH